MWQKKPNRREFLGMLGAATGAGSLGLLGCNGPSPPDTPPSSGNGTPPPPDPSGSVVVRRDVMSAEAAADLEAYAQAVGIMRGRATSTGWEAQARIHDDHCPHGNAFFLPWHRGYLHYFEEICREASGKADFALPYWDWTTHPTLPPAFWQGSLNDPTRTIGQNQAIPPQVVGPNVISGILGIRDFETFGSSYVTNACATNPFQRSRCGTGELEGVPHNNVHGIVGGNMATFMSPLDPIFWLHHCNVDRLWMEWNKQHTNGANPDWRSFVFQQNFVNAQGQPQDISVEGTFSTFALGYRYDTQAAAEAESLRSPQETSVVASAEAVNSAQAQPGEALQIAVDLPADLRDRLRPSGSTIEAVSSSTVRLVLGGVPTPQTQISVNVYVGSADAPTSTDSPHYVRTFGFFPVGDDEHAGHANNFLFDIGDDLERLGDSWNPDQPLSVHVQSEMPATAPEAVGEAVAPTSVRVEVVEVR